MLSNNEQMKNLIDYLRTNSILKNFRFYEQFLKRWTKLLKYYSKQDVVYSLDNLSDNSQAYIYKFHLRNNEIRFHFSVDYIKGIFARDTNHQLFKKVNLVNCNSKLFFDKNECLYTHCEVSDFVEFYENLDEVFFIQLPTVQQQYVIIDGNHRVCGQIQADVKDITAYFCYNLEVILRSLMTPLEAAMYACLFDCAKIEYNLNKYSDLIIKKQLDVFNEKSFVNNLETRGTIAL